MVRIVLHKSRIKLLPPFILWRPLSLCLLKTRVLQSTAGPKWDKNGKSPIRFKLVLYRIFKSVFFKLFVTVAHPCPSCSLCAVIELSTKCLCRLIVLSRQISSAGIGFYFAKTRLDICSPKGPMQWPARETGGCMHPTFPPHWGLPVLSNCNPNWQKHRVHEDVKFQQVSLRPAARKGREFLFGPALGVLKQKVYVRWCEHLTSGDGMCEWAGEGQSHVCDLLSCSNSYLALSTTLFLTSVNIDDSKSYGACHGQMLL